MLGFLLCFLSSSMTINNPILMAMNILIVAMMMSVLMSMMMSSWYAMLMYLIYIGGMMVMFSYFIALSPNQNLKTKQYFNTIMVTIIFMTPMILMMKNIMLNNQEIKVYDLYMMDMKSITMLLILILLMMLLVIVKMVKISKGPLRPFNYVQTFTNNTPCIKSIKYSFNWSSST
uniref:NADH dehydrogenase subunit 6 n=1 Tax=Piscicola geometra TaxID=60958 RepID=A0A7D6W8M8_9ANNE|nr:NADH dehydrogenase subunit 6 [Piscicola geometra]